MGGRLGPFWLNRRLAGGRTGEVWSGVHRGQGVQVAVKFLTVGRNSPAFRAVFTREIEVLGALDHPNIVRIWDHGLVPASAAAELGGKVKEGAPYLVMEQGRATLGDRKEPLPWSGVRQVAVDLLAALGHAHANGLLHRDLKPANVLLCPAAREGERHRVVLTDFGFAGTSGEETAMVGLTPSFAAPEQLAFVARDEGPWTDLFALGCMIWSLLSGRSPFEADTVEEAQALQARKLPRLDGVDDEVGAWIRGLVAISPWDRPRSAAHALQGLAAAEAGRRTISATVPDDWRGPETSHPGPRNLAGAGLGLVGIRSGSIGREEVKDELWARLRRAAAGEASAVVLRGVEGIGKTHLSRWLPAIAHERCGASELVVNGAVPGEGLVAALRRRIGLDGLDGRDARNRVAAWLEQTGGAAWLESRSALRLLEPGQAGPDRWPGLCDLVRRVARSGPLVLRVEDAHAVPDAAAFTTFVLGERADLPVAIVLTVRDDAVRGRFVAHAKALEVRVPALKGSECDRLVGEHLGLAPALRGAVAGLCVGNPGVAQRLLRRYATDGSLAVDPEGRWDRPQGVDDDLPDEEITPAEGRLVAFGVARPEPERHALELAAFLGPEIVAPELQACWRQAGLPVAALPVQLVSTGLWEVTSSGWSFADGRVGAAAVRQAVRAGRSRRWHEVVATVLATVPGAAAQVRRATHLARSGRTADALGPWRRGLDSRLEEQPPATTAASLADLRRHVAALSLPEDDARTVLADELEASLWLVGGEPLRARRLAVALAERAERWPDVRSVALRVGACLHAEALEIEPAHAQAGLAFEAAAAPEARALALLALGEIEFLAGRTDASAARLREALAAAGGIGFAEGKVLVAQAWFAVAHGQRAEARALVARAAAVVERTGRQAGAWALRGLLGRLAATGRDAEGGVKNLTVARDAWDAVGQLEAARRAEVPLGRALLVVGDAAGALACFRRASASQSRAVQAAALAGRVAVAAAAGEVAVVDARLAELASRPGVSTAVLPDVAELLVVAARTLDPGRAEAARKLARVSYGPLGRAGEL